jgi:hypothetical protein
MTGVASAEIQAQSVNLLQRALQRVCESHRVAHAEPARDTRRKNGNLLLADIGYGPGEQEDGGPA